jgi:hypothetical protein
VSVTDPNIDVGSSSNSGEERLDRHEFQPRTVNFAFEAAHRASNFNHETKPPVFYNQNNEIQEAIRPSLMSATTKRRQDIDKFLHAFTHLIKHVQQQNSNSSVSPSRSDPTRLQV